MNKHKLVRIIAKHTPVWLRRFLRRNISMMDYDLWLYEQQNPYASITEDQNNDYNSPYLFGIVKEFAHDHKSYIIACQELGVPFKVLDISGSNWIDVIKDSQCDIYLIWPSVAMTIWNEMFDDRVRVMVEEMGKVVYPTMKEIWIYENKRRARDWLIANDIPHPETWVFYNMDDALAFADKREMPIVFKTNLGASASGVKILRDRASLRKTIRRAFQKGVVPTHKDKRDVQWGSVLLQEYLHDVREWRMVRIGDSYFGYRKEIVSDFHSGSHGWSWDDPPKTLLNLLRDVTEKGSFTSMDVDIFETTDGRLLVNELQTVFGATTPVDQLRVNDKPGRYIYKENSEEWIFEDGDFSPNACANERIKYLIETRFLERFRR
ncbi:MAG: hypothetical protein P9L92_01145 [Candidatus Electryonea clarkiae]|nr:hypothetical protein [Candidatus Electryonea clarkiae]MDP8289174.1 hypothetical protein [Candidatus Electryonea clarkiae]